MKISPAKASEDLRRRFYLIRYYEGCRADYVAYSAKNPVAIKIAVIETRLQRLISEARAMMEAGIAHDATKLPRSLCVQPKP